MRDTPIEVKGIHYKIVHRARKKEDWWVTRCGASFRPDQVEHAWTDASQIRCLMCFPEDLEKED